LPERLAIDGGTPVRAATLPYGRQWVEEADIAAVDAVLRSDWLTTGPVVDAFEEALAERAGSAEAVVVNSGTAALHAAAWAAGLGPGDELVVPALTFAASANCARYLGATPVFADVRPDTLNVDPASVAASLTLRTRAILAVDYAGQPADLDALASIARDSGLALLEDASHALGARHRGRPIGSVSDLTAFSFHPVKHVTTGEGGAITTADPDVARRLRQFRNHGITTDHRQRASAGGWFYEMVDLGFNYRLPDINCALGLSQLARLDAWLARRRAIDACYRAAFAELPEVVPVAVAPEVEPAWHLFPVLLAPGRLRVGRGEVFAALRAEGLGVNVHYVPVYWHPYYQALGYRRGLCPVAEDAYERLLSLPLFPAMTDRDVDDVITAVGKVVSAYAA
jgi:perosamine synthetase